MEVLIKKIQDFEENVERISGTVSKIITTRSKFYKEKLKQQLTILNREFQFLRRELKQFDGKIDLKKFEANVLIILDDTSNEQKNLAIKELSRLFPEIEAELSFTPSTASSLFDEIPAEIPDNESRRDIVEAIKDYENECYVSATVLCRRSYEGALVEAYRLIEKKEPNQPFICKHCKNTIRQNNYFGIVNLHNWAFDQGLIAKKTKSLGFIVSDLGAGGAHPPLSDFPREKELAKVSIVTTIALVKQIYTKII